MWGLRLRLWPARAWACDEWGHEHVGMCWQKNRSTERNRLGPATQA
jgi:hypothetical protein